MQSGLLGESTAQEPGRPFRWLDFIGDGSGGAVRGVLAEIGAWAGCGSRRQLERSRMGLPRLGGLLVEKRHVRVDDQAAHLRAVSDLASIP